MRSGGPGDGSEGPGPGRIPGSVADAIELLDQEHYVADEALGTALFLAFRLGRPLLLEGEAGVGKTEVAKAVASGLGRRLIRLQCYEGLDLASAAYEWNYASQMVHIRIAEADHDTDREALSRDIFSPRFLIKRPLLESLEAHAEGPPILLIDELDRTDEPFEAYLLEILSDFQLTVPEIGTFTAEDPPIVIITSNRTREIHDALKRRCIYHWIDYPAADRELAILAARVPEAPQQLSAQIVAFVQRMRGSDLFKLPGVAETIDWTRALMALDRYALDPDTVNSTLGVLLKYQDDLERVRDEGLADEVAKAVESAT